MPGISPQYAISHMVECSAPQPSYINIHKRFNTRQHGTRGLVSKCGKQDTLRLGPLLYQMGNPVRQRPRLAASGSGNYEDGAASGLHGFELLKVEFFFVVNHVFCFQACLVSIIEAFLNLLNSIFTTK